MPCPPVRLDPPVRLESFDTLRRGEVVGSLLQRQGIADLDLSPALDPRRLRAGLVFAFHRPHRDSLPSMVRVRSAPEQIVTFERGTNGWNAAVEERGVAGRADADRGQHRGVALRCPRRRRPRRQPSQRRPHPARLGSRRRLRLAGGLQPRRAAGRPVPGRLRAAGLPRGRGAAGPHSRERLPDRRPHPHRVPLRLRRPLRAVRRRRQLAAARLPPRAGRVPADLLDLCARAPPPGARHLPPPRGHRLRRQPRHAGDGGGQRHRPPRRARPAATATWSSCATGAASPRGTRISAALPGACAPAPGYRRVRSSATSAPPASPRVRISTTSSGSTASRATPAGWSWATAIRCPPPSARRSSGSATASRRCSGAPVQQTVAAAN